jgi:sec-independent protein translocase protein TatB
MLPENRLLEILIIGALALIVVGPKDLPILMRKVGQFVGKMRSMAAEFRASFDELARQSELEELRKEVDALRATHADAVGQIHASLDEPIGLHADTTPSYMMPLSPPIPTPIDGAEPAVAAEAPKPAPAKPRKPRAPKVAAEDAAAPAAKRAPRSRAKAASGAGEAP